MKVINTIAVLQNYVKKLCDEKGFKLEDTYDCKVEKVARLHSEVSEYFDIIKKGKEGKNRIAEELADILFLLLNLTAIEGVDLEKAFLEKLEQNYGRPYKYGTFEAEDLDKSLDMLRDIAFPYNNKEE